MKTHSFAAADTGLFTGRTYSGPDELLALNTPPGTRAIEGSYDHLSQRLDLATGQVTDWQPPAPADTEFVEHRWDAASRRWQPHPTLAEHKRLARAAVQARIDAIEAQQPRALRELVLAGAQASVSPAWSELVRIESEMAACRTLLEDIDAALAADDLPPIMNPTATTTT